MEAAQLQISTASAEGPQDRYRGRVDVIANIDAIIPYAKVEDRTPENFRQILEVNCLEQCL